MQSKALNLLHAQVPQLEGSIRVLLHLMTEQHRYTTLLVGSPSALHVSHTQVLELKGNIRVLCRIRPFVDREQAQLERDKKGNPIVPVSVSESAALCTVLVCVKEGRCVGR